jgi:hypothetical protein
MRRRVRISICVPSAHSESLARRVGSPTQGAFHHFSCRRRSMQLCLGVQAWLCVLFWTTSAIAEQQQCSCLGVLEFYLC